EDDQPLLVPVALRTEGLVDQLQQRLRLRICSPRILSRPVLELVENRFCLGLAIEPGCRRRRHLSGVLGVLVGVFGFMRLVFESGQLGTRAVGGRAASFTDGSPVLSKRASERAR